MKDKFSLLFESIMSAEEAHGKIFKYYVIVPNEKLVFGSDNKEECDAKAAENPIWKVTLGSNLVYMGWDLFDPAKWLNGGIETNEDHTVKYTDKDSEELMGDYGTQDSYSNGHFTND